MDCCEAHQNGDDGVTVLIDEADLARVAPVIKARTTRRLSAEHREKLLAAGIKYRRNRTRA
jgi:hypothetical protein